MIYAQIDNTDVPVEVLEYIAPDKVKVQSKIGSPFGPDAPTARNRLIGRRSQSITVVRRDQIKVVQDG